jgi:hypothetical protein
LVTDASVQFWTKNGNHIPMCWHLLQQFATPADAKAAKDFVVDTVQHGWIDILNLTISWESCPTSGKAKHVRVLLRIGDAQNNGTTLKAGMATLSTPADRLRQPPNDPPGYLMGFPSNWNANATTRAQFRSLILHEFGHVLGFDHEQIRSDGPPGVACYKNAAIPGAIPLGPPDPQSIMGWSYCATASGTLTPNDVSAARTKYGRSNFSAIQLHGDGEMWTYMGTACVTSGCYSWDQIDRNGATVEIAVGVDEDHLFQRHSDGTIWRWDGYSRCNVDACPGWQLIDRNPSTVDIVAASGTLVQRHNDGSLYVFTGIACSPTVCPGWKLIDRNPATKAVTASRGLIYQMHTDGQIWRYDGSGTCADTACPGWLLIDRNSATVEISGGINGLFQRHSDGQVWKWDGDKNDGCTPNACPRWLLIDRNPNTNKILAGGRVVSQVYTDGKIWTWDSRSRCDANGCPGWSLIDDNRATVEVVAAGKGIFQRHANGWLWQWDERSRCASLPCPGWAPIDKNGSTKIIVAVDTNF